MKTLKYPFTLQSIKELHAGDGVRLSGTIYTGRDRLHKFMAEGGELPVDLHNAALFHCGPVVVREDQGWRVKAAGPTTSIREEPYMAKVIASHGVRVIIGKGGMGQATLDACKRYGCIYLQATGGAAALLARGIKKVDDVYFLDEFGATEAMWKLEADSLDLVVGMDTYGCNLYAEVRRSSFQKMEEVLKCESYKNKKLRNQLNTGSW
ncbi:MAG: FumA C-terminus/TtdB family hydratase beta subunit [Kiritimatiellae bacterium]|jgi:tartrate/fumarate subfamily iron-sulfur-dependent hydro-lyase beta chain|nr:FumA C-terminus/TtdB family hydratase beta subunit [Kiritimatiellia bacterium]